MTLPLVIHSIGGNLEAKLGFLITGINGEIQEDPKACQKKLDIIMKGFLKERGVTNNIKNFQGSQNGNSLSKSKEWMLKFDCLELQ